MKFRYRSLLPYSDLSCCRVRAARAIGKPIDAKSGYSQLPDQLVDRTFHPMRNRLGRWLTLTIDYPGLRPFIEIIQRRDRD